jgi:N-acetylglutamate synthase-like GNAT family acetyltransferase
LWPRFLSWEACCNLAMTYEIRPVNKTDEQWVDILLQDWWAGSNIITRGKIHQVNEYPGFVALQENHRMGLITYHIDARECEITSLNSLDEGKGIGTALVKAVQETAKKARCKKLFLITTNDNTGALHFWQKRGFRISAVRLNAIAETRKSKPGIPLANDEGIPIRDEIELDMKL